MSAFMTREAEDLSAEVARLKAEAGRLLDEHLLDLKDKRSEIDNLKTWTVALFAHVCRLTGKNPKDGPREIQEIAANFSKMLITAIAERDAALTAIDVERELCAQVAEAQPFFPDTVTGARQQWVREQIAAAIRARGAP